MDITRPISFGDNYLSRWTAVSQRWAEARLEFDRFERHIPGRMSFHQSLVTPLILADIMASLQSTLFLIHTGDRPLSVAEVQELSPPDRDAWEAYRSNRHYYAASEEVQTLHELAVMRGGDTDCRLLIASATQFIETRGAAAALALAMYGSIERGGDAALDLYFSPEMGRLLGRK